MRLLELIQQHGLTWPPPPIATGGRITNQGDMRNAILQTVEWRDEPDGDASILVSAQHRDSLLTSSMKCPKPKRSAYRTLYDAMERGRGQTLAEIEKLEVETPGR